MEQMVSDFTAELQRAKAGESSSLKYLSSYLGQPTGREKGDYLALDFGGTNIRIVLFRLLGNGLYLKLKENSFLLKTAQYDYTVGRGEDLFNFLAVKIKEFLPDNKTYFLGHTFSFPFLSLDSGDGTLLKWTKEFKVEGVVGQKVNELLNEALLAAGVKNVKAVALINDTVAVLLAGSYVFKNCLIGSVIGTGFNCCCFSDGVAVNLECGNFNLVEQDKYDRLLDEHSKDPGQQIMEKMISGYYLGERVRLLWQDICPKEAPETPFSFSAADLSAVLAGQKSGCLQEICRKVLERSADLAAVCYRGILDYLKPPEEVAVLVDGSVFLKAPGYKQRLKYNLAGRAQFYSLADISALGAAIGAGLVQNN